VYVYLIVYYFNVSLTQPINICEYFVQIMMLWLYVSAYSMPPSGHSGVLRYNCCACASLWDPTALQYLVKLIYTSKILAFATLKVKRTVRIKKNRFKIKSNRLYWLAELHNIKTGFF
jgi:hypothetical protein